MTAEKPILLFFRGLNTYGDDTLHVGPFTFGESFKEWCAAVGGKVCEKRWDNIPVRSTGTGSIADMAERSRKYLLESELWINSTRPVHILAHSTGGVVARALVQDPAIQKRVLSLTTVGTPHFGASAGVRAEQVHPSVKNLLKTFGYDLETRKVYFKDLLPESMQNFNSKYPNVAGIRYASLLSEKPAHGPSLPMQMMELSLGYFNEPSDGLIPVSSQKWGEVLGHLQMDHLELAGFCFHFRPRARRRFQSEWKKMFSLLERFWLSLPAK